MKVSTWSLTAYWSVRDPYYTTIMCFRSWFSLYCVSRCSNQTAYITTLVATLLHHDDHPGYGIWGKLSLSTTVLSLSLHQSNEIALFFFFMHVYKHLKQMQMFSILDLIYWPQLVCTEYNHCLTFLYPQFALLETVMTAIQDTVPSLREKKTWVVLVVCILGFCGGLAVTCEVQTSFLSYSETTDSTNSNSFRGLSYLGLSYLEIKHNTITSNITCYNDSTDSTVAS